MSEKIKIYGSRNGMRIFIHWNGRFVHIGSAPRKVDPPFTDIDRPIRYELSTDMFQSNLEFPTKAERNAAYDELIAKIKQAKKQLTEAENE